MARCRITKPKTLNRLSEQVGFAVIRALTRGGTNHRVDVIGEDGVWWCIASDGTLWQEDHNHRLCYMGLWRNGRAAGSKPVSSGGSSPPRPTTRA